MSCSTLPERAEGALRERLARIRYVFTDMDGTMLRSSCVLMGDDGAPSLDLVSMLLRLRAAGVEVIPCSGRNRAMLHEDTRVLGLNSFIGEMGGILALDDRAGRWEYFTVDMAYDPACGLTPHEVIERTGICEEFGRRWPGLLEYHNDMANGYKYREVTIGLRGEVPDEEAREILSRSGLALDWSDNGFLNYISAPTTLKLPGGVRGRAFNIQPGGLNKGRAIERFCKLRGIDTAETMALGDSRSDFSMASAVEVFLLVENGLENPGAREFLAGADNAFVARGSSVTGWVHTMETMLEAQSAV